MRTLRERITERIDGPLEEARYIYDRYKVPFCLLIGSSSKPVTFHDVCIKLRQTDGFFAVDETLFVILFRFTSGNASGLKAAENFLHQMEKIHPNIIFHCGIACHCSDREEDVIGRAIYAYLQSLNYLSSRIEDDYEID